ncbi:MAG: hypothetical protein KGR68_09145 [Betaproteobacteria bacterium]|nr:hypothetical protein [Betaproteobacteria bacterium]
MGDEDNEPAADENVCPFCASADDCEHLLLVVDLTFGTSDGGALFDAFGDRWRTISDQENDDFDERETFTELLEEVDSLSDASLGYVIEGGPGMTSEYRVYFCLSQERVQAAVARFEAASSAHSDVEKDRYELEVPDIVMSASVNAFSLAWDSFGGEELVCGRVLEVRYLTKNGSIAHLESIGWDAKSSSSTVVTVEYEVWVMPKKFAPENPQTLIYRRERVAVDLDDLVYDRLVTYGLGPERNHFDWVQISENYGNISDINFPEENADDLADKIKSMQHEGVIDFFKDGGQIPENLSKPVLDVYLEFFDIAQNQNKIEEQETRSWEAAEFARENEDRLHFSELKFDVDAIERPAQHRMESEKQGGRRLVMILPSIHKSRLLYIFSCPPTSIDSGWNIEASIVRKVPSKFFYVEQAKEKFEIFIGMSDDDLENAVIAQIKDGSMAQRFSRSI